jgi:hypothetical protein
LTIPFLVEDEIEEAFLEIRHVESKNAYGGPCGKAVEIFVGNVDGSNHRQLTRQDGMSGLPVWSRDGKRIVFQHTRHGARVATLYIMNDDGSNLTPILKAMGRPEGGRAAWLQVAGRN